MKDGPPISGSTVEKCVNAGIHVLTLSQRSCRELFITATPTPGYPAVRGRTLEPVDAMFGHVADLVRDAGARVVSQDVFGLPRAETDAVAVLRGAMGDVVWPVTWVEQGGGTPNAVAGTQVWAVAGAPVQPVEWQGVIVGSCFEDDHARYCRLGGIASPETSDPPTAQTRSVLERMDDALSSAGMAFRDVVRTWFFNRDILAWYDAFNQTRDAFFGEGQVFDGLVPASTGIGGGVGSGPALVGGLLAVKAKAGDVRAAAVPSPLQCPALDYGSSFSRAVELVAGDHRRLFVSGTASISPEGHTIHDGDVDAQVARTMEVVEAILESRGMAWADVARALAYFKHRGDMDAFGRYCAARNIPALPVILVHNDVCRGDLLFEIELDALISS